MLPRAGPCGKRLTDSVALTMTREPRRSPLENEPELNLSVSLCCGDHRRHQFACVTRAHALQLYQLVKTATRRASQVRPACLVPRRRRGVCLEGKASIIVLKRSAIGVCAAC